MTVTRALAWLADPAVAAATSPGPGEGFDVAEFVSGRNTLYMIGTGREEAPIAPLFRAFAEYVHAGAAFAGSLQPHGRLDPPMLMALDEVTQICPVPLPLWMADSAGKGILIVAVCHGLAQLEARWDSAGARAIWDTAGIKVILGGVSDPDTLDRLSRLCGEIALRTHSRTRARRRAPGPHRDLPAGPGPATRTAADPARMARPDPARQPVPRHRPAPDGLAPTRLPPRPPDRRGTTPLAPGHRGSINRARNGPSPTRSMSSFALPREGDRPRHSDAPGPGRSDASAGWSRRTLRHRQHRRRPATAPPPAVGTARRPGDRPMTRPRRRPEADHPPSRPSPSRSASCAAASKPRHQRSTRSPAPSKNTPPCWTASPNSATRSSRSSPSSATTTRTHRAPWFWLTMTDQERDDRLQRTLRLGRNRAARPVPRLPHRPDQALLAQPPRSQVGAGLALPALVRRLPVQATSAERRRRLARPLVPRRNPPPQPGHGAVRKHLPPASSR